MTLALLSVLAQCVPEYDYVARPLLPNILALVAGLALCARWRRPRWRKADRDV